MKRKFSFNLAPIKVPSKPEAKAQKDATPNRRRDSISPPPSPFINRRPLSSKTEAQLRLACALILQDYKPSGHVFEDYAKPKLDFDGLNRAMREKQKGARSNLPRSVEASGAKPRAASDAKKYAYKPDTALKDLFPVDGTHPVVQANTSRRREDRPMTSTLDEGELLARARSISAKQASLAVKSPGADRPQTAPNRNAMDSDDTSLHTPMTGSTENHNNVSTAPTSAAFTSTMNSKRTSQQAYVNDNAAVADAAAAEWMRQELEKRRLNMLAQDAPKVSSRPPSRSRSIRSEIREYIRPSLSRSASRESMRSNKSDARTERGGSTHGWRSWTLQRKTSLSSFKDSKPGSVRGRSETRGDAPKPELNLNRELPPLPSLDKWAEQDQRPEPKSNQSKVHIANLMRAKSPGQDEVAATRRQHRRSGSDSLAKHMSFHEDAALFMPPQNVRVKSKPAVPAKSNSRASPQQQQQSNSTTDVSLSTRSIEEAKKAKHQRHKSTGDESYKMKMSMDGYPKNFSRKLSSDATSAHSRVYDPRCPNVVEITALPPHPEKQSSKLRKVFSSWVLGGRKEKKHNNSVSWADALEQPGMKGGVLVRNEPARAPVVKY
ncbi:hypothetical protein AOQ84DRAFT_419252 [Glonium stellatum]|uniref:Uncharacterized protein n=1 Tax=Glonium stellatum TaxID=574774 RepID=A0A8E2ER80_9PEZI|nr:hypothetical protein AOQ84DRAFT_419252 [Glonium stellatum]